MVKVRNDAKPADLMTKHFRAEVASQHLEALRFYIAPGRAASAPALLACSHDEGDDRWMRRDGAEVIERRHHKPRFALFTPMKVAKGPKSATAVGRWRVTIGELADGQEFVKIDDWKAAAEPHQLVGQPWAGIIFFTQSLATPRIFAPAQLPMTREFV